MTGNAVFRDRVLLLGANLYFDWRTLGPHERGVQRLVTVHLGNRNIVFESRDHRTVETVHNS